jgi:DNA-binding MarR family transcriptional regulator
MMLREEQSISSILMRMEKRGLLKRTKDMEPKNLVRITLTSKGDKYLKQAMKKEGTTNVMARLTMAQQKHLKTALTALKEAGSKELYLLPKEFPWP